jgi:hypothetical protein
MGDFVAGFPTAIGYSFIRTSLLKSFKVREAALMYIL